MSDYTLIKKPCYFCGNHEVSHSDEHWYICPRCGAAYTFYIIWETNCDHIHDRMPTLLSEPIWPANFFDQEEKPHVIIKKTGSGDEDWEYACSVCDAKVVADGW